MTYQIWKSEVHVERRGFIFGGGAVLLVGALRTRRSAYAGAKVLLAEVEAQLGGRIGVAAVDVGTGARMAHRGGERFAMCSTFKWLLAAAVLAKADDGVVDLDQRLSFAPTDVLDYSPVTKSHVIDGGLSIKALCEAAVEASDNTAANTLLTQQHRTR